MAYSSPSPTSLAWADTRRALLENGDQSGQSGFSAPLNPCSPCSPVGKARPLSALRCHGTERAIPRSHPPCSTLGHSSASAGANGVPRDGECPSNFQPASLLLLIASRGSACPRSRLRQGCWGLSGLFVCLSGFLWFGVVFSFSF